MGSYSVPFDIRKSKIPLGPGRFIYRVHLKSAPVTIGTIEWLRIRQGMLDAAARDIDLTRHSGDEWTELTMKFKQGCWELSATYETPASKGVQDGEDTD